MRDVIEALFKAFPAAERAGIESNPAACITTLAGLRDVYKKSLEVLALPAPGVEGMEVAKLLRETADALDGAIGIHPERILDIRRGADQIDKLAAALTQKVCFACLERQTSEIALRSTLEAAEARAATLAEANKLLTKTNDDLIEAGATQKARATDLANRLEKAEGVNKGMEMALIGVRDWLCYDGPVKDDGITHAAFVKANNLVHEALAAPHGEPEDLTNAEMYEEAAKAIRSMGEG